jgi:hypothetical protein
MDVGQIILRQKKGHTYEEAEWMTADRETIRQHIPVRLMNAAIVKLAETVGARE